MSEFRKSMEEFHDAMHRESEWVAAPPLSAILARDQSQPRSPGWAIAATVLMMLGSGLTYREMQQARAAEQEKADARLLREISVQISRPVARALSPLMGN